MGDDGSTSQINKFYDDVFLSIILIMNRTNQSIESRRRRKNK